MVDHPLKGKKQSPEHIAKRAAALKGKGLGRIPWNKGGTHSEETRTKIREARARQVNNNSDGIRRYIAELKADPIRYEAYRAKLREAKAKSPTWNKGGHFSEESCKKMSEAHKGVPCPRTPEHNRKIGEALKGKRVGWHHTEEHKQKLSTMYKGRALCPPESRNYGPDHHNYGKPAYKGAGNGKGSYCKKGHYVRSTWERAIADWLFDHDIPYEYEAKLFDLGDGIRYRPDFHLIEDDIWIEVKGYERDKDKEKALRFTLQGHTLFTIDRPLWNQFQATGQLYLSAFWRLAA